MNRQNRRRFLKGALGVTLGLPLLESLDPGKAEAAVGDRRFVVFFCCNGVNMNTFWPTTGYGAIDAAALETCTLAALAPYASKLLIPRGIHTVPRGFGFDPSNGCDHQKGMGHKLTAQALGPNSYAMGISADQFIAGALNEGGSPALTLQVGYRSDSPTGHISYSGPEQPVTGENNPWLAYQDLVGLGNLDEEELARLLARRQSVLDLVQPEYERLLTMKLSKADRDKLDMHFTAVRDLENNLGGISCNLDPARAAEIEAINPDTVTYDSEYKTIGRMHMDVMAMAIACGANRASTLQWGSGAGGPIFKWDGMNHDYNHHKLSHGNTMDDCSGGTVPGYELMLTDIDRWYAGELAYLLGKLDAYDEGASGSVLDNSCVMMINELSHGKDHDFRDLPIVLAGSCGGYFKSGQYIKVTAQQDTRQDQDSPHNKLLTTIINAVGVTEAGGPVTSFGDLSFGETGEFDMLKA